MNLKWKIQRESSFTDLDFVKLIPTEEVKLDSFFKNPIIIPILSQLYIYDDSKIYQGKTLLFSFYPNENPIFLFSRGTKIYFSRDSIFEVDIITLKKTVLGIRSIIVSYDSLADRLVTVPHRGNIIEIRKFPNISTVTDKLSIPEGVTILDDINLVSSNGIIYFASTNLFETDTFFYLYSNEKWEGIKFKGNSLQNGDFEISNWRDSVIVFDRHYNQIFELDFKEKISYFIKTSEKLKGIYSFCTFKDEIICLGKEKSFKLRFKLNNYNWKGLKSFYDLNFSFKNQLYH